MEFENSVPEGMESAETEQEVAVPANEEETGSNEQEFADPASEPERQDSETNAAFQRMRHERQEMQAELDAARAQLEELKAQTEARDYAFQRLTGSEDGEIAALAEVTGMSEDEVRAEMEAAQQAAQKDLRIQQLEAQVESIEADKLMEADLRKLQKIDPTLNSLEDLGPEYFDYVIAGLPPERAYYAIKAEEGMNLRQPPKAMGKVATGSAEKDYFTDAEIDSMSSEQLTKNYKKILASWDRRSRG